VDRLDGETDLNVDLDIGSGLRWRYGRRTTVDASASDVDASDVDRSGLGSSRAEDAGT
jgi:hypothetical protein